jgi:hypothetical protein
LSLAPIALPAPLYDPDKTRESFGGVHLADVGQ